MNANVQTFLHRVGSVLAVAGLALVLQRLYAQHDTLQAVHFSKLQYLSIAGLAMIYGLSGWLLAMAWQKILAHLGTRMPASSAIRIYGLSQIGKYLPGNIFHLAGRQGLGMAEGVPSWTLIKSTVWELGLMCTTASPFLLLVAPAYFRLERLQDAAVAGVALLLMVFAWVIRRVWGTPLMQAFFLYLLFLCVAGLVFAGVVNAVSVDRIGAWGTLASCFVIAWLMGLVVPGAPAGIGIRELVLLGLLANQLSTEAALLTVGVSRIVTAAGDVLFWLGALTLAQLVRSKTPSVTN